MALPNRSSNFFSLSKSARPSGFISYSEAGTETARTILLGCSRDTDCSVPRAHTWRFDMQLSPPLIPLDFSLPIPAHSWLNSSTYIRLLRSYVFYNLGHLKLLSYFLRITSYLVISTASPPAGIADCTTAPLAVRRYSMGLSLKTSFGSSRSVMSLSFSGSRPSCMAA